jgi:hypothetical protein
MRFRLKFKIIKALTAREKKNKLQLKAYHKRMQDPVKREKERKRMRKVKQAPGYRERHNKFNREAYHKKMQDPEYREKERKRNSERNAKKKQED